MRDFAAWIDFPMNKVSDKVKELQQLVGSFNLTCPTKRYSRWGEWPLGGPRLQVKLCVTRGKSTSCLSGMGKHLPSSFNSISFLSDTGTTEPMFIKLQNAQQRVQFENVQILANLHSLNFCSQRVTRKSPAHISQH